MRDQGHFLIKVALGIGMLAGLLLLIAFFSKRSKKTKSKTPEILNFDEGSRRNSRKGRSRSSSRRKRN